MFGGHWSIASRDIKHLTCNVILQNHVIKGSSNFISGSSLWYVTASRYDIFSLSRYQADHLINGSSDYNDRNPSK